MPVHHIDMDDRAAALCSPRNLVCEMRKIGR
jgi:hypothetical protein